MKKELHFIKCKQICPYNSKEFCQLLKLKTSALLFKNVHVLGRAGRVNGGTIVLAENEWNDQERSHCSEKNERLERVLKNIGTISKRTERNGTGIA